jgi:hypothetical protein
MRSHTFAELVAVLDQQVLVPVATRLSLLLVEQ